MQKTITYEQFISWNPCWLGDKQKEERLEQYAKIREHWTALDILRLEDVETEDKLWVVLRPELIDEPILHEFACRCAERALSKVDRPDPRSIAAIGAKRAWVRGEIDNAALDAALAAARDAAWDAAQAAARAAAWDAAQAAARAAAWAAARAAARDAAQAAARAAAQAAERQWQVAELIKMLEEFQDEAN